ncbi:unannotated protein [freshwater metagenome]|uniref:Unannotated protein n=1 Tax=freshwater metagenome TaxID=449393 RepID=A0A6J7VWM5_9ZZZZ
MSDSVTRAKPSIAEPSKPIPSSKAFSSSAGAMATDFKKPKTSVNHKRTKRIFRSSIVRRTNSCCLSVSLDMSGIVPNAGYGCVNRLNNEKLATFQRTLCRDVLSYDDIGIDASTVSNSDISDYTSPSANNNIVFNRWMALALHIRSCP